MSQPDTAASAPADLVDDEAEESEADTEMSSVDGIEEIEEDEEDEEEVEPKAKKQKKDAAGPSEQPMSNRSAWITHIDAVVYGYTSLDIVKLNATVFITNAQGRETKKEVKLTGSGKTFRYPIGFQFKLVTTDAYVAEWKLGTQVDKTKDMNIDSAWFRLVRVSIPAESLNNLQDQYSVPVETIPAVIDKNFPDFARGENRSVARFILMPNLCISGSSKVISDIYDFVNIPDPILALRMYELYGRSLHRKEYYSLLPNLQRHGDPRLLSLICTDERTLAMWKSLLSSSTRTPLIYPRGDERGERRGRPLIQFDELCRHDPAMASAATETDLGFYREFMGGYMKESLASKGAFLSYKMRPNARTDYDFLVRAGLLAYSKNKLTFLPRLLYDDVHALVDKNKTPWKAIYAVPTLEFTRVKDYVCMVCNADGVAMPMAEQMLILCSTQAYANWVRKSKETTAHTILSIHDQAPALPLSATGGSRVTTVIVLGAHQMTLQDVAQIHLRYKLADGEDVHRHLYLCGFDQKLPTNDQWFAQFNEYWTENLQAQMMSGVDEEKLEKLSEVEDQLESVLARLSKPGAADIEFDEVLHTESLVEVETSDRLVDGYVIRRCKSDRAKVPLERQVFEYLKNIDQSGPFIILCDTKETHDNVYSKLLALIDSKMPKSDVMRVGDWVKDGEGAQNKIVALRRYGENMIVSSPTMAPLNARDAPYSLTYSLAQDGRAIARRVVDDSDGSYGLGRGVEFHIAKNPMRLPMNWVEADDQRFYPSHAVIYLQGAAKLATIRRVKHMQMIKMLAKKEVMMFTNDKPMREDEDDCVDSTPNMFTMMMS